jgi:hypothetical protein
MLRQCVVYAIRNEPTSHHVKSPNGEPLSFSAHGPQITNQLGRNAKRNQKLFGVMGRWYYSTGPVSPAHLSTVNKCGR